MSSSAAALREFLQHPDRPPGTLSYLELQGLLFAVTGAPELILPSEWMSEALGDTPEFKDADEARTIQTALVEEYNAVNDAALEGVMPPGCVLRADPMANLEDDAPIREWARGFVRGYDWLSDTWSEYLGGDDLADDPRAQEMEADLGGALMVLSFFASREMAESVLAESGETDLPTLASEVHGLFPEALRAYTELGRAFQSAADEMDRTPYQREAPKIGRNDPCLCGSGKKYKRCCGASA